MGNKSVNKDQSCLTILPEFRFRNGCGFFFPGTVISAGSIPKLNESSEACPASAFRPNFKIALRMVVLIADDDQEDCELFHEAIHDIDPMIKCWTARDGKQCLNVLMKELILPPDYIFLDINMPLMNGKDTLIEIKKNTKLRDIPVVMYSTTSDTKEIQSYYKLGAHDFLIKPNNFNKLVEALSSIIISTRTSK